jgi:hypothetical protein
MQIFVKNPLYSKTHIYNCFSRTTLYEFVQWVENTIGVEPEYYYARFNGNHINVSDESSLNKTFKELGIDNEATISLHGKIYVHPPPTPIPEIE